MAEPFPAVPDLTGCLRQLLAQIPPGSVTTCGDLADALGNRIAAKWVGHFALHHDHDAACVCHRIVRAGGELGAYIAGSSSARRNASPLRALLRGTARSIWSGLDSAISFRITRWNDCGKFKRPSSGKSSSGRAGGFQNFVGGVDVAYPNAEEGVAAYALVETATGQLVWSTAVRRRVVFPYISTYLSFREIPILLDLLDEVRAAGRMAEVLLVDGSGILHHRHAGIASHLGVVASAPTIGVTKKLLCGSVDIEGMAPGESRPVVHEDRPIGIALRPTAGSRRPIFISPGHRVDLPFCEQLVRRLLTGRRLPEPLYWADRLGKKPMRR